MIGPTRLFRFVARAEAVTWALLLVGMVGKYVTETTELGVRVFGMAHGVVFIAYVLTALAVGIDQRWNLRRLGVALASAVPPFATFVVEAYAERHGWVGRSWRLRTAQPARVTERAVAWVLRHPGRGAGTAAMAVAALTGLALLVGPPVG